MAWRCTGCWAAALLLLGCGPRVAAAEPKPALGINLSGPADWNTELPFVDAFRLSRAWISQRPGAGWGQGPKLDLDEHGWVKRLEEGCFAETPVCTIASGRYPSGRWTILWEGAGKVALSKGKVVEQGAGRLVAEIDSQGGGFFVKLLATDPANPVRRLRALMPGVTAEQADRNPWNPTFLARWRGMACLRFMDFQETNNSTQKTWSDRPLPTDATWTRRGIPIELLCDLANRLEADAWFCLPHLADDDHVRRFAALVQAKLDPRRKAYIEYSNEVWNGQFEQHRHAGREGQRLGLAEQPWEAAWKYTARRSVEIFRIWEEVFGGRERLVRVLPAQSANKHIAEQILGFEEAFRHADVLAIAPYISMNIPVRGNQLTAAEVAAWDVDRFLDHVEQHALPESLRWCVDHKAVADRNGLRLVCYEAGQHFVGVAGGENDQALTKLLHAANAHPRLRGIYDRYYAGWQEAGGDLLCHFSSVSAWSKWGSWGLLQFHDDDPKRSPKFSATMDWGRKLGQNVAAP